MTAARVRGRTGAIVLGVLAALAGLATAALARLAAERFRSGATDLAWVTLSACVIPGVATLAFAAAAALSAAERRREQALAERRALHPSEPWRWEAAWEDGRIPAVREGTAAAALVGFALFWNAFVGGAAFLADRKYGLLRTPSLGLGLAVFALAGAFLIVLAVYQLLLAWKYEPTVVQMSPWPGILGGRFGGVVQLPPNVPEGADATVALTCYRVSYGGKTSSEWGLWHDEARVATPASGALPVSFKVPFDLPASTAPGEGGLSRIDWRLRVSARVPGVDWSAMFHVPVFQTEASDPSIKAGAVEGPISLGPPRDAKLTVLESGPNRTVLAFPPAKGLGCGITALLVLPLLAWPVSRLGGLDLAGTLAAFGVGLLLGTAAVALTLLGVLLTATRLEVDREALRVRHGKGRLGWTRTIPLGQVKEVKCDSSGDPPSPKIDVHTADGKSYWISGNLSGLDEAKWLTAEIARLVERHRT